MGGNGNITMDDSASDADDRLILGDGNEFQIYRAPNHSMVTSSSGNILIQSSNDVKIGHTGSGEDYATFNEDGAVKLFYNGHSRLETISTGMTCFGNMMNQGDNAHHTMFSTNQAAAAYIGNANRSGQDESLVVLRGDWNGTPVGQINIVTGIDVSNKDDGAIHFQTTSVFGTDGLIKRMTILRDGKIGINDATPAYKLDVKGDVRAGQDGTEGLILTAPNGNGYRVTVTNAGALSVSAV